MTPLEAVRKFCIECAGSVQDVIQCGGDKCRNGGCDQRGVCWFFPYRLGKGRPTVKVIRKTCVWCMNGSEQSVRECHSNGCALWQYRLGTNPARRGIGNPTRSVVNGRWDQRNPLSHTGQGGSMGRASSDAENPKTIHSSAKKRPKKQPQWLPRQVLTMQG